MTQTIRPDFPILWDNTMRSSFATCPKKFYWEFIRCLGSSTTSIHLHFGACFASGIEAVRMAFYSPTSPIAGDKEKCMLKGVEAILTEWGDYETEFGETKTLDNCIAALESYFIQYPPATDIIQPYFDSQGQPGAEFSFSCAIEDVKHPVTGEELIYCGRFDMLGIFQDQLFIVDEKTTKSLGDSWLKQWNMRSQFTGYCWGAKQYGLPVAGAVIRGTSILKTKFGHAEVITYRPDWHIEMWYEQLVRDLKRAIQCWEEGYWDMNLSEACTSFGGCSYERLCNTNDPERWAEIYYVERKWNPMARDQLAANEERKDGNLL